MKICIAGEGAIANQHLKALARIEGVEVVSIAGGDAAVTAEIAKKWDIPHWSLSLEQSLARPGVEAAILATPTQLHAGQAETVLRAGKHVLVEIPMADTLRDAERLAALLAETGLVGMVCHTRRFNPGHVWMHNRIRAGELALQHLVVESFFYRRSNINALGQPRSWVDHLLWHHACHTVDLFQYQSGEVPARVFALEGPKHPAMGISLDMSIGLQNASGALCSLALSFNNDGPLGTAFRYICDKGTYIARYDDLVDGNGQPVDLASDGPVIDGFERQDREFFAAIAEGRQPNAGIIQCIPVMHTLNRLEQQLQGALSA